MSTPETPAEDPGRELARRDDDPGRELARARKEDVRLKKKPLFPGKQDDLPDELRGLDVSTTSALETNIHEILDELNTQNTTLSRAQRAFITMYAQWCLTLKENINPHIAGAALFILEDVEQRMIDTNENGEIDTWRQTDQGNLLRQLRKLLPVLEIAKNIRACTTRILQRERQEFETNNPEQARLIQAQTRAAPALPEAPVAPAAVVDPAHELQLTVIRGDWERAGQMAIRFLRNTEGTKEASMLIAASTALLGAANSKGDLSARTRLDYVKMAQSTLNGTLALVDTTSRDGVTKQLAGIPSLLKKLQEEVTLLDAKKAALEAERKKRNQ